MKKKRFSSLNNKEEQLFLNAIGRQIKHLRVGNDWSQERLGFKSNLDRTYIGGIERGERNPSVLNIKKIADAFGVPAGELFPKKRADKE